MNKKEYKEALSNIKVTPELKEKLLDISPENSNKRYYAKLCISFAVCILLISSIAIMIPKNKTENKNTQNSNIMKSEKDLQSFTLGDTGVGGMGINGQDFQEDPIKQWQNIPDNFLPVYKNLYNEMKNGNLEVDKAPLKEIALEVASYLNEDVELIDDYSNTSVMYGNENISISVSYNRNISIYYNVPQFYENEKELLDKFGPWLGENVSIKQDELGYKIYVNDENPIDNLVHYVYKYINIGTENQQYMVVHIQNIDLRECLGYYPIISEDEVKERVEKGEYINSNQNIGYTKEDIQNIYLMYKETLYADTLIPYYQCILKDGQILYIPAVEEKYIEDY